jgi:hypothetical protein
MLDTPISGRIFLEQVIRDNLDIGRPDQVGLVFDPRPIRRGPRATPGRFRTRVITAGVTPSLHMDAKHTTIKQYGNAPRTESTITDTNDFGIGKRPTNLPALREIGDTANRRLLGVQRIGHDPITGARCPLHRHRTRHHRDRHPASQACARGERRSHACSPRCRCFGSNPTASPTKISAH